MCRGSSGRAQAGTAGPERRDEGQRKLCWPTLPQPHPVLKDHKPGLPHVHLVLAGKSSFFISTT